MNQALSLFLAENHKPKAAQKKLQAAKGMMNSSIASKAGIMAFFPVCWPSSLVTMPHPYPAIMDKYVETMPSCYSITPPLAELGM